MAGITQDWEPVVIRKKAPTAAARKDEKAVNAARRAGAEIETVKKSTAGTNKAASSTTTLNIRKLDEEMEKLAYEKVPSELIKDIIQEQLAQLFNEKPQVIQEYESGKAIPNQQIITKLERAQTIPNQQIITKLERVLGYVKSIFTQTIGAIGAKPDSEILREASKGEDVVAEVRKLVDELAKHVSELEVAVDGGNKVDDKTIAHLTEMLMRQLLTLDGIEAAAEGRNQRRMEVRRVQSLMEHVDVLKSRVHARTPSAMPSPIPQRHAPCFHPSQMSFYTTPTPSSVPGPYHTLL